MLQQRQESNLLVKDWWLQVDWIDFFFSDLVPNCE